MKPTDPDPHVCPANKIAHQATDALVLGPYLSEIARDPAVMAGQHPIRAWEYAMALRTLRRWTVQTDPAAPLGIADIGGAGSGFWRLLTARTPAPIAIIDPTAAPTHETNGQEIVWKWDVESFAREFDPESPKFDVITCISVIEHVPDVLPFIRALHTLLRPGGLLLLTTDYWDADGPDVAHFHWMRERIYNKPLAQQLLALLKREGFERFGGTNWTYRGPQVYDYSVLALALTKEDR